MICQTCKKDKPKSKFYKLKAEYLSKKNGKVSHYVNYSKKCKECYSSKDKYHKVYLIWNERYVGVTANLSRRMKNHKGLGKDISKVYVLYRTKNLAKAKMVEAFFHVLGFKGLNRPHKYL